LRLASSCATSSLLVVLVACCVCFSAWLLYWHRPPPSPHSFPTRRSSDLTAELDTPVVERPDLVTRFLLAGVPIAARFDGTVSIEDRKSTRLHSSHVSTSYAVFRLEEKNEVGKDHHHLHHQVFSVLRHGRG